MCAALADPIRAQIVELLSTRDLTAGEIAARFTVSGPAISRHLRVLRQTGLATYRRDAQRRVYSLNPKPLLELDAWIAGHRRVWRARLKARRSS